MPGESMGTGIRSDLGAVVEVLGVVIRPGSGFESA